MLLQAISGGLGGIAGVLYAFNMGTIAPHMFGFNLLLYGFTIVFVGGISTMWGVLIFAPILWAVPEFAPAAVGQWRNILFATIIIGLLIWRPGGVITKNTLRRLEGLRSKTDKQSI